MWRRPRHAFRTQFFVLRRTLVLYSPKPSNPFPAIPCHASRCNPHDGLNPPYALHVKLQRSDQNLLGVSSVHVAWVLSCRVSPVRLAMGCIIFARGWSRFDFILYTTAYTGCNIGGSIAIWLRPVLMVRVEVEAVDAGQSGKKLAPTNSSETDLTRTRAIPVPFFILTHDSHDRHGTLAFTRLTMSHDDRWCHGLSNIRS
jgi:hypothetical protein